jgi:hypothetical protein
MQAEPDKGVGFLEQVADGIDGDVAEAFAGTVGNAVDDHCSLP